MSTRQEIMALLDIEKQLTEAGETIDKMREVVDTFGLKAELVNDLDAKANAIQDGLSTSIHTIRMIKRREYTGPLASDPSTLIQQRRLILQLVRDYKDDFLQQYQGLVEQLLDSKDEVEKRLEAKRQAGEEVPSKEKTEAAFQEAKKKLQVAKNESAKLQKGVGAIRSFIKRVKPYVEPLVQAAKIVLPFLL